MVVSSPSLLSNVLRQTISLAASASDLYSTLVDDKAIVS